MAVSLESNFPGGNGLLLSSSANAQKVQVRFAAECKNCPQAMWFYFRLSGLGGRAVRAVLANPEQTLGGPNWSQNRPVARRLAEGAWGPWGRLGLPEAVASQGRVEWAWQLPPAQQVEIAFCYPYIPCDLDATLNELGDAFSSCFIGLSAQNQPLVRLFNRAARKDRPAVYLTARHHAGETPGSWVLDGLLRSVAQDPQLGELTWWAVPFVDLDNVLAGSYGKDPYPHDCNRSYGLDGPRRPEASAVWADVLRLRENAGPMLLIDLHAPSHYEQAVYVPRRGWDADAPVNPMAEDFANRYNALQDKDIRSPLAHILPDPPSHNHGRQAGLSICRWAMENRIDAVTIETSYQGNAQKAYEVDDYRRLGIALARAAAEWLGEKK
jgi:hypothetical protein